LDLDLDKADVMRTLGTFPRGGLGIARGGREPRAGSKQLLLSHDDHVAVWHVTLRALLLRNIHGHARLEPGVECTKLTLECPSLELVEILAFISLVVE
jgi:hypothetical protein